MGHSDYFVVISNGYAQVTRPDGGVKFTIHESGAIGAGMSPNGEFGSPPKVRGRFVD